MTDRYCNNCASMHQGRGGICRCSCHMPKGLSGAAYQKMRSIQMREHNDAVASGSYGDSYF